MYPIIDLANAVLESAKGGAELARGEENKSGSIGIMKTMKSEVFRPVKSKHRPQSLVPAGHPHIWGERQV